MTYRIFVILTLAGVLLCAPVFITAQDDSTSDTPSDVTIHVIQRGENLFRIALQYGLTTQELAELNGILDVNNIQVGQRLLVPSDDTPTTPEVHIVQPGESLYAIAQLYGVKLEDLASINSLANANQIYPGQELRLVASDEPAVVEATEEPTVSTDGASATPEPTHLPTSIPVIEPTEEIEVPDVIPTPEQTVVIDENGLLSLPTLGSNLHTVQRGETLYRIAIQYGLTVPELASANSISDPTRIFAGQQLIIPGISDTPAAALDLPSPITQINVEPLIFVEGETGLVSLLTEGITTIRGQFFGQDLRFISVNSPESNTQHLAFIPIAIFTDEGTYPITLTVSTNDGIQTDFSFNIRIVSGGYGVQNLNVNATELLAPAVQEEELNIIQRVTSEFSSERFFDGAFSIPAAAAMNARYGTRRSYNGGPVNAFHSGADFASSTGAPIYAASSGRVVLADTLNIRGNTVVINHGWGIYSLYAHLNVINVSVGDMVTTGQVIGLAGSTGRVTGPHLHWEVWVNGVPVNPLQWNRQIFP